MLKSRAPSAVPATLPPLTRRMLGWEIIVVFAVSLGASALFAIINLIGSLTAPKALRQQQALLVGSMAPGRPLLDLTLQLASIVTTLAPVALVFYLLAREGEGPSALGIDTTRPASDVLRGAVLGAVIGGTGLALCAADRAADQRALDVSGHRRLAAARRRHDTA